MTIPLTAIPGLLVIAAVSWAIIIGAVVGISALIGAEPEPELPPRPDFEQFQQDWGEHFPNEADLIREFNQDVEDWRIEVQRIQNEAETNRIINDLESQFITEPIERGVDDIPDNESLAGVWDNPNDPFPPVPGTFNEEWNIEVEPFPHEVIIAGTEDPNGEPFPSHPIRPTSPPPEDPPVVTRHQDADHDGNCDMHGDCGAYDPDPNEKGGGKDPVVLRENWGYFDFNAIYCSNAPNSFDYDNDGFPEHMCYWYTPTTKILFNDRYDGKLVNGLNFIGNFTHIWQDKNSNIFIDDGELTPIEPLQVEMIKSYPDGVKDLNDRYIYCAGESNLGQFVCTQPTYWKTQEWMRQ